MPGTAGIPAGEFEESAKAVRGIMDLPARMPALPVAARRAPTADLISFAA
jgi:hypothetical protein